MARRSVGVYKPGDLIYSGKPFVKVLDKRCRDEMCANCLKRTSDLKWCNNCRILKYCSRKCQKEDWSDHKLDCKILKNLPDIEDQNYIQLLGKLILKFKDRPWDTIQERVGDRSVSFADLKNDEMNFAGSIFNLKYKETEYQLRKYIGENTCFGEKLMEIIKKLRIYTFAEGVAAFFLGASIFATSCVPNAFSSILDDGKMQIRIIKTIDKDSSLVTIKRYSIVLKKEIQGDIGAISYNCKCAECSLPYGESILTKIVDEEKAFNIIVETWLILRKLSAISQLEELLMAPLAYVFIPGEIKDVLERQDGVLGNTNILRLRLLAWKYLFFGGPDVATRDGLEKLAKYMKLAFGEFYHELIPVYLKLKEINLFLQDPIAVMLCELQIRKVLKITFGVE